MNIKREERWSSEGWWEITVHSPSYLECAPNTVKLTEEQYIRYRQWLNGNGMIQERLFDLPTDKREILLTGLSGEQFDAMYGDD